MQFKQEGRRSSHLTCLALEHWLDSSIALVLHDDVKEVPTGRSDTRCYLLGHRSAYVLRLWGWISPWAVQETTAQNYIQQFRNFEERRQNQSPTLCVDVLVDQVVRPCTTRIEIRYGFRGAALVAPHLEADLVLADST